MSSISPSKHCYKCDTAKPLSEFHEDKRSKSGLQPKCRDCRKQHYQANRERILEQRREYRKANHEQILEYLSVYYQANLDKRREYLQANRERLLEQRREYSKANPHVHRAVWHRRRARKLALPDDFTTEHMAACLEYFHHTCAICGSQFQDLFGNTELHWDHWIPLSSDDCPGTVATNMLCTCSDCNLSKRAKLSDEWLKQRFGTRKAKQIMARIHLYFGSLLTN